MLEADSCLLAIPKTAENLPSECSYSLDPLQPGKLVPNPISAESRWGEIDFSPAGATLYRMVSAEWVGHDWEHDLIATRTSEEGFEEIVQEHIAKGNIVRTRRVATIGPWCVKGSERFPRGYRLELELLGRAE